MNKNKNMYKIEKSRKKYRKYRKILDKRIKSLVY